MTKNGYKFISKGENFISELGYKNSSTILMPKESVLFSSRAPIGILAITKSELCTNQGFKSIVPKEEIGAPYVYYYLKYQTDDISNQGSGTTFSEVSGAIMKAYPAYIPSKSLIEKFNKKIQVCFDNQYGYEQEIIALRELKGLLLSKMTQVVAEEKELV